jgi:hypothetical protein
MLINYFTNVINFVLEILIIINQILIKIREIHQICLDCCLKIYLLN